MENRIQEKINEIFTSIEIYPEYSSDPIKILQFKWNLDMIDFIVEYYIHQKKYVFHYNEQIAKEIGFNYIKVNPLEQLENEVKYIKRMYERGIGAKEYYPFTNIQS